MVKDVPDLQCTTLSMPKYTVNQQADNVQLQLYIILVLFLFHFLIISAYCIVLYKTIPSKPSASFPVSLVVGDTMQTVRCCTTMVKTHKSTALFIDCFHFTLKLICWML